MRSRRYILGAIALAVGLAILIGVAWKFDSSRQPLYQGRTVTAWSLDLLSPSSETRSNAATALVELGPSAVPTLIRQLHRRDSWLQRPFLAVTRHAPRRIRPKLIGWFRPFRAVNERKAAAAALPLLYDAVPRAVLFDTLRRPDRQMAAHAATALAQCGAEAVPGLTAALSDPDAGVRALACYALGEMGSTAAPAAPALAKLLNDPAPQMLELSTHVLTRIGPAGVPGLLAGLESPEPRVRAKAAFALGQIRAGATDAVPALERLADDADPNVRQQARAALRYIVPGWSNEISSRHGQRDF